MIMGPFAKQTNALLNGFLPSNVWVNWSSMRYRRLKNHWMNWQKTRKILNKRGKIQDSEVGVRSEISNGCGVRFVLLWEWWRARKRDLCDAIRALRHDDEKTRRNGGSGGAARGRIDLSPAWWKDGPGGAARGHNHSPAQFFLLTLKEQRGIMSKTHTVWTQFLQASPSVELLLQKK